MTIAKWTGKMFVDFCKSDLEDTRKINYKLRCTNSGKITKFTSDDVVEPVWIARLRDCRVNEIQLIDNEWYADLSYDGKEYKRIKKQPTKAEKFMSFVDTTLSFILMAMIFFVPAMCCEWIADTILSFFG